MDPVRQSRLESVLPRASGGSEGSPRLEFVSGGMSDASLPEDPVERALAKCGKLAVLPQVVCQIVEETDNDDASIANLEKSILVDPGFSTMLLAQSNSAFYALPRKVTSIREAVMFLGFKGVRQMAMAVGVFDLFVGKTDAGSLRRRSWWKHSLETAHFCRAVGERISGVESDQAYTCGLLHLIGKTILDKSDPDLYSKVQTAVEQGAPDVLAERAVFGCDHVKVVVAASESWGFPTILIHGMDYFTPVRDPSPANQLRATVALGSRVTKMQSAGANVAQVDEQALPAWILETLELTDNDFGPLVRAGMAGVEAATGFSA